MIVAAIDRGTTSTRVLVADPSGHARIRHAIRHAQFHPHPGWVEHNPLELLANIRACLQAAGPVEALGLANQGESCLAWDAKTLQPLSPVIVWQDNRTAPDTQRLKAQGAEAETLARAGLPLDAYFSATKLAWLVREIPEIQAARRANRLCLGTTDAFFLHHLTGRFTTDVTTASRTSLMNLATRQWDTTLCALFGVPPECLPEIRDTVGAFGDINKTPLTASVVDQQAALYGHGCRRAGDAKITFGTGAFALAVTGAEIIRAPEQGLLPTIAWSRGGIATFALDGGVYDAGAAIEWAERLGILHNLDELHDFQAPPAITRGLVFVPALSGLACPHWDRSAAALWLGMDSSTTRQDLLQALLEGVALRTAEVISAMHEKIELKGAISVDGGLTRSPYFLRVLASALGRELAVPDFDELTAFGCAALAAPQPLPRPGTTRAIAPSLTSSGWRERFAEAITRARGWR
ncbi:FGGY family carbohydrate kinase [Acidocella sp.]|uniref:FGGY family carbohydrate kinase n=1 Tax=Acidocella sp. TaxID=50710 RepID=UPI0026251681|nr:FGGY family carbohydrate kinase [Acidocella sp.]